MSSHTLSRDVTATVIPAGNAVTLPACSDVYSAQSLGGNITVRTDNGLFQIAAADASAIAGFEAESPVAAVAVDAFSEQAVWDTLKTCFDPEIPVNIVDLGL